jgi:hypothetical protein
VGRLSCQCQWSVKPEWTRRRFGEEWARRQLPTGKAASSSQPEPGCTGRCQCPGLMSRLGTASSAGVVLALASSLMHAQRRSPSRSGCQCDVQVVLSSLSIDWRCPLGMPHRVTTSPARGRLGGSLTRRRPGPGLLTAFRRPSLRVRLYTP